MRDPNNVGIIVIAVDIGFFRGLDLYGIGRVCGFCFSLFKARFAFAVRADERQRYNYGACRVFKAMLTRAVTMRGIQALKVTVYYLLLCIFILMLYPCRKKTSCVKKLSSNTFVYIWKMIIKVI